MVDVESSALDSSMKNDSLGQIKNDQGDMKSLIFNRLFSRRAIDDLSSQAQLLKNLLESEKQGAAHLKMLANLQQNTVDLQQEKIERLNQQLADSKYEMQAVMEC